MLNKMKLWDKILVGLLIIISFTWLGLIVLFNTKAGTKIIEISVYGEIIDKFSLRGDTEDIYSFDFGQNTGYIEVKDGAVRMLEMDKIICPDAICSRTGWIKEDYELIVCMPNGIVVNIKNNEIKQDRDIDILG